MIAAALEATEGLMAIDSAGLLARPFGRSALHVRRGQWSAELGDDDEAISAWLWHLNTDLEGVPGDRVQAGEVDGALGTHARAWVAIAAARVGDAERACRNAAELGERCDADRKPAYLECDDRANLPFYERSGFRVVHRTRVLDVPVWCMWRDPN